MSTQTVNPPASLASLNAALASRPAVEVVPTSITDGVVVETSSILRRFTRGEKLPSLREAIAATRQVILASQPKDMPALPLAELRMAENGGLYRVGRDPKNAIPATHSALSQVFAYVGAPRNACNIAEYLPLEGGVRSNAVNAMIAKASREAAHDLVFRTALHPTGSRYIRAAATTAHSLETGDNLVVIDQLEAQLSLDSPTRMVLGLDRFDFEIIEATKAMEVRKGDAIFAKIGGRNSETKAYSFFSNGGIFRLTCLNGMTRADESSEVSVRHVGDLSQRIRRAIQVAGMHVQEFAAQFRDAYSIALPLPRAEVLQLAAKKFDLSEAFATRVMASWDMDGTLTAGDTLAGLVNALTRASQEETYAGAEGIEAVAGEIVMGGLRTLGLVN